MEQLQQSAKAFGLSLSTAQLGQFEDYWTHLSERNQVMNLTAIKVRDEAIEKHFLDSLTLAHAADFAGKRLIDVGTGAGFPGLPLKIAVPTLDVTLLDSLAKRVGFLEEVTERLALIGIRAVHGRAEEWVKTAGERESYDFATSRAVAELRILLELTLPYVKVGGTALLMKTARSEEEVQNAQSAITALGGSLAGYRDYTLPSEPEVVRRLIMVRKDAPTPEKYPRRFAKIQKQPLG